MAYLSPSVLTIIFTFIIMSSVWAILYLAYAYNKEQAAKNAKITETDSDEKDGSTDNNLESDKDKVKKDVQDIELNDDEKSAIASINKSLKSISKSLRRIEITVSAFIVFLIIFILTKF